MASTKQTAKDPRKAEDVIEKVQHLVSLATQNDNEHEASSSALAAVKLMAEHELTVLRRRDLEAAQQVISGAQELVARAKAEGSQKLVLGLIGGLLLSKGKII